MQNKNVTIYKDIKENRIIIVKSTIFRSKNNIPWDKVEEYLKRYIGQKIVVDATGETIIIDKGFPDEFKGSKDTSRTKGANAKAKANLVQGICEMIMIARKVSKTDNYKEKNKKKAINGWLRYFTRFALPVVTNGNTISYFNVFHATLIVRIHKDEKLYLYDVINVKKDYTFPNIFL